MISIIISAYNAEKTIEKCLNSILENKYNDYEIILVNDGSMDKTEQIVQLFATDKIKYFYKQNTGLSDSRNYGIKKANGDYITFVDADDYVTDNYFENLDKYINEGIDVIKRKAIILDEKSQKEQKMIAPSFEKCTGEEAFNLLCFEDVYMDPVWLYVIKKSLLINNNLEFGKSLYHEDFGLTSRIILKANSIISLDDYVYYYVLTDGSIMREKNEKKTIKKANDVLIHYDNILDSIKDYKLSKKTIENVKIYCTNVALLKVKELSGESQREYIKELKRRKIYKNIKVRNIKQLIKKILLFINIKLYCR